MGTNEEYLDSLLKNSLNAIDDGNSGMERIAGLHKQNQEPEVSEEPLDLFAEPISDEPIDLFSEPISDEPIDVFSEPISDEPIDLFAEPISDEPIDLFAEPIRDEPIDLFSEPISDEPIDLFAEPISEEADFMPIDEQEGIADLIADFGTDFKEDSDDIILEAGDDEEPLMNQTIVLDDEDVANDFTELMPEADMANDFTELMPEGDMANDFTELMPEGDVANDFAELMPNEDTADDFTDILAAADAIEENPDAFDISAFENWANEAQEQPDIPIVPSPQDYSQSEMFSDDNGKKRKRIKKEKVKKEKVKKEKVKKEKVKKERVKKDKNSKQEEPVITDDMIMEQVPEMPLEDFGFSTGSDDIPESMFATDIESMFQSDGDFATEQSIESILLSDADELASIPEKNAPKKDGFFARMTEALFAEDEEEPEDTQKVKEKKSKKDKKGKKDSNADPELAEDDLEDAEQQKGKKKKEKVKKEKKPKKEKVETPKEKSNLSLKRCLPVICICVGIGIILIVLILVVPDALQMKKARSAYYNQNYEEAYEALSGCDLNASDKILYRKAEIMMLMETKVSDYELHSYLGQKMEALDDVFIGLDRYYKNYGEIEKLNILTEANTIYQKLLEIANTKYNLSEEEIRTVLEYEDPVTYTKILDSVLKGNGIDIFTTVIPDEPVDSNNNKENINNLEDVMDEEQDIIDQMADYLEGQGT